MVPNYNDIVYSFQSSKKRFPSFGLTHTKVISRNILIGRLIFSVMHIQKNLFESIFNKVMDIKEIMDMKEKTKDNIKAIVDISLFCHHKNIELVYDVSRVVKFKASFALNKNSKLLVCKLFDGHASIISRLVNLEC